MMIVTTVFRRLNVVPLVLIGLAVVLPATAKSPPAGFEQSILSLERGGAMNYYHRPGEGPTLVLVPGTWGGIWRFESLIARLPDSMDIAVVELCWQDKRTPATLDMDMVKISDDVLRAIKAMKLTQFVIAGHSIGGMIAVEIVGREVPGLVGAIPMEGWTHHTVLKTAFNGVVVNNLTEEEEALRAADRARGLDHLSDEARKAIGTIWRAWNGYASLERSTVPVLQLWGDRSAPRPDWKALQIPQQDNITIGWIANASHLMLLEDPDAVARLVADFMTKLP